jgi:hypothetical protein
MAVDHTPSGPRHRRGNVAPQGAGRRVFRVDFRAWLGLDHTVDDMALAHARETAARLTRVMETHEVDLARAAEAKLFPDGAPVRVTIATIMRALVASLMDAAQHLAESDAAYNATLREHEGGGASDASLLSQDVAEKIALSVELEDLVLAHADDAGARLERKLFPGGLPEQIGLLGIFQALRRRLELATTQDIALLAGPEDLHAELHAELQAGQDAGEDGGLNLRELLEHEMASVAQLFAELSEICNLPGPSRAIRDVIDISDGDSDEDGGD